MVKRGVGLMLFACVVTGASWAASKPFVGDWKFNPSKSTLTDRMKVESAGGNKYTFNFGGGPETITIDGTDQPSQLYGGGTLSVAVEGDTWKVIRKNKDGRTIVSAVWSLSKDGNTLTDHYTGFNAGGSPYRWNYRYKRTAGGPGFAATWVSTSEEAVNFEIVLQIRPYEGEGLSFIDPSSQLTGNMQFAAAAVRRVDEHTLELMRKKKDGSLSEFLQLKLSPDSKTLTMVPNSAPGDEPHILLFERQ